MKQLKHVLAISAAAFVAMASAVPLAEAGHGGGGFGGGGFGGHGFGGGGFGGHAFSTGGFSGHSFSGHAFGGSTRGVAVGPRGGFAYSGPHGGRAFVGPRGGVYANRHNPGHYYAHNDHHGDHDHDHHFHHGHRVFVGYGFYDGYYDDDYGYYDNGGCGWLYRRAIATGSPYWWNRYQYCVGSYD